MSHTGVLAVEEHIHGDTVWVALRARGADWSWLTRDEAIRLAREWLSKYDLGRDTPPFAIAAE
jgi:hypothetical protein